MPENKNEKVSVIVPVHNAEKYLAETINSILKQSYKNLEILLVDDGSTDQSMKIAASFDDERIRLLSNTGRHSAADARNLGIKESTGRYIAYLDADDIWDEKKIEKTLGFMWRENAAFVYTAYEFADENAAGTGKIVHVEDKLDHKHALSRTIIFTSTVMFDMTKLSKELIYMPHIESEDTASWWNILRTGVVARGLDESLTLYRRPASSLSSNKIVALRRIWRLYRVHEKMGLLHSCVCFVSWAVRAAVRRM
ncbi:MAG: glycosyltransferase family 2 protein [Lachnospiraceae bacterium]|nr:glycosyltransferase family 2 protein [Lachnospiraceae bacterium]